MRHRSSKHTRLNIFLCIICNNYFQDYASPSEKRKVCSKKCRSILVAKQKRTGEIRKCKKCKKEFYSKKSEDRRGYIRKYCSLLCTRKDSNIPIGRYISYDGYWIVKKKKEHRTIMETHLKRKLLDSEIVHHKNHNKLDNRLSNLEIMSRSEHNMIHRFLHNKR